MDSNLRLPVINSTSCKRRSNKPLMEKRRRERINQCLNELKDLVLLAQKKDPSRYSKLEKADILEMTVRHVESLHKTRDLASRASPDHNLKYKDGFSKCASEVENFLNHLHDLPRDLARRVITHLKDAVATMMKENISDRDNSQKSEVKIKAAIDNSVFQSAIVKHEIGVDGVVTETVTQNPSSSHNLDNRIADPSSTGTGNNSDLLVPVWNCPAFPPSPPDSSRSSTSPDLYADNHRVFWEFPQVHGVYLPYETIDPQAVAFEEFNSNSICKVPQIPINQNVNVHVSQVKDSPHHPSLSTVSTASMSLVSSVSGMSPSITSSSSSSLSAINLTPKTPSVVSSSTKMKGLETRKQSRRILPYPIPYPKKDAVKRYNNETNGVIPKGDDEKLSMSHWRPW